MDTQNSINPNVNVSAQDTKTENLEGEVLIIRMWPKTPMLYPMAVLALIFSFIGHSCGTSRHLAKMKATDAAAITTTVDATQNAAEIKELMSGYTVDRILGTIFLIVFAFSLFTLCVDFEVRWALISFSGTLVFLLFIYILNERLGFMPHFIQRLTRLTPIASPQFYMGIFIIWGILMLISLSIVRFHYIKIESNEVIVIGGLMERQQRYPTLGMKFDKDIQDVIEYYLPLVRSGRLILNFHEGGTVVIENVIQIEKVIKKLDVISSVLNVSR